MRHKGNKERYVRNLYKTAERKKKDDEEEAREIKRIDAVCPCHEILEQCFSRAVLLSQAAQAAYAVDVGAGRGGGPVASSSASTSAAPVRAKTAASYTTAEDLGFVDEDEIKRAEEAAVRQTEGKIGDWEVVAPAPSRQSAASGSSRGGKRSAEQDTAVEDEDDIRSFQVKKRKLAVGIALGDIYDPGVIAVKGKKKETKPEEVDTASLEAPRWNALSLKKALDEDESENGSGDEDGAVNGHKVVVATPDAQPLPSNEAVEAMQLEDPKEPEEPKVEPKIEEPPVVVPPAASMFRKRRGPAATTNRARGDA